MDETEIVDDELVEVEDTDTDDEAEEEVEEEIDWKARAEKAEALIVKNKKAPKPKVVNKSVDSDLREKVERQGLQLEGYAPEVIDKIMELGGAEALSNPILKNSADVLQEQYKAQQAADIKSGPNSTGNTKYSKEDLENMSAEELEKVLPHADN